MLRKSEELVLGYAVLRDRGPKMSDPKLERRESVGFEFGLALKRVELGCKRAILVLVIQTEKDIVNKNEKISEFWAVERPAFGL